MRSPPPGGGGVSIIVRFRKELVALLDDLSQMYHQFALTLDDRPPQYSVEGFRSEPEVYEFMRHVFEDC